MRSLLLTGLVAFPAFATGEKVLVTSSAEAFRETLCVSMTCVSSGPREFVVTAQPVKGGVELTVKSASGQVKLVHVTPLTAEGDLSIVDVVTASSLAVGAIENPKAAAKEAPAKVAKAPAKRRLKMFAHR